MIECVHFEVYFAVGRNYMLGCRQSRELWGETMGAKIQRVPPYNTADGHCLRRWRLDLYAGQGHAVLCSCSRTLRATLVRRLLLVRFFYGIFYCAHICLH